MKSVAKLRQFNRAITRHLGVLENDFLGRKRSLGESRILYEIGTAGTNVRDLRSKLGLDSGYCSRLVKSLEESGLVRSRPDKTDARVRMLALTAAGKREVAKLDEISDAQALAILEPLTEHERLKFLEALDTVEGYYDIHAITIEVEDPETQTARFCISQYYTELAMRFEGGFDPAISISAKSAELRLPDGCLVVARLLGAPVGCGALKLHGEIAELKRMWVSRARRGTGLGRRVLNQLETIAANNGVKTLRLETNKTLKEAQSLYRSSGYAEVSAFNDEPYAHHWFEKQLRISS
jgi:DNA-binding MarR family transcriptional regulator